MDAKNRSCEAHWSASRLFKAIAMLVLASGAAVSSAGALAQQSAAYPERPIRMIMPFGAGGPADSMARLLARGMEANLNVAIIVENKVGAGGLVGAAEAARAKPDGYTVLYTAGSAYTISPAITPSMQIDMARQFIPVSYGHRQDIVLVVNSQLPVRNIDQFVAYAKSRSLNYASPGRGTSPHLMVEVLKDKLGFQATHIPYKSGADMQRAGLAGEVEFFMDAVSSALPNIRSGRIRAIALSDTKRVSTLPDVPTFAEQGVQDMVMYSWGALLVPAGTSPAIVIRLHAAMVAAQKDPDIVARMKTFNAEPYPSTPQQVRDEAEKEAVMWTQMLKKLNLVEN
ncbi:MAG: tripartite tricarboxylate transporter substrate binding protein [Betaproteobacteria bacterium]|nr:tripartite tricarboxylate transporter substrate binding protein [Betaproteobacteria bacterium]